MAVRSTMAALITETRLKIADPAGGSQQFTDQQIQDRLDDSRNDIRYEALAIAPSIVNTSNTAQSAQTIFADYYSAYQWWEADVVLQGQSPTALPWVVLTPAASDYIVGHWQFELDVYNTGTVPGQVPPVFATGKVYDCNMAAAELLQYWAALLSGAYDMTVDGQTLRRSQLMAGKLTLAQYYLRQAKPRVATMRRSDIAPVTNARSARLLDSDDVMKGA